MLRRRLGQPQPFGLAVGRNRSPTRRARRIPPQTLHAQREKALPPPADRRHGRTRPPHGLGQAAAGPELQDDTGAANMLLTRLRIGTHGVQTTPVVGREMDGGTLGCGHGLLLVCE